MKTKNAFALALFLALVLPPSALAAGLSSSKVAVYKSDACSHCTPYLSSLYEAFGAAGITDVEQKDFLNDPAVRAELANVQAQNSVPITMQGHLLVIVDGKYLFEGHVPPEKIVSFLENDAPRYDRLVAFQDSMGDDWESYSVMNSRGEVRQCAKQDPIASCENGGTVLENPSGLLPPGFDSSRLFLPAMIIIVPIGLILVFGRKVN